MRLTEMNDQKIMKSICSKFFLLIAVTGFLSCPVSGFAYSVLTHEAIIDASWEKSIQPLLKQKYPGVADSALNIAHSYAYGGAIAPDMGYFPFGSPLFTNLVHYVRSGNFVNALLDEAQDVNEYAFALGFLCHYMADKYGHLLGTNLCVPIVYPKVKKKYGSVVTYEEDRIAHKRIEFAFDVLQTAKGNYATLAYHDFIGFNVSRPVLERAFRKTYGLNLNDVFGNLSLAIDVFRWSVKSLFPVFTRAAWLTKKNEILKAQPTATSRSFRYRMNRSNNYQYAGSDQKKLRVPGNIASWFILVLPKVGPLKALKIKEPGPEAEKLFIQSFDTVLIKYSYSIMKLGKGDVDFMNIDFDTGNKTAPGEYMLADKTYGKLLLKLHENDFSLITAELKLNVVDFFNKADPRVSTKRERKEWEKITVALKNFKQSSPQKSLFSQE